MSTALLFPGQGSQTSDMGELVSRHEPELRDLAVREVGADPFALAGEGTAYAQPAILCASIAAWTRAGRPQAPFLAGHSLGELSALAAAGALEPADALRLAVARGHLMQEAAGQSPGGMLALLGDAGEARAAAAACGVVVANDNGPTQLVVAGSGDALDATAADAKSRGVRAIRLAVRGAFHTPEMERAVGPFKEALERAEFSRPAVPVFSSITAAPFATTADEIREQLALALIRPVRWRETMIELHSRGVRTFIESGPGKALTGMVRRAFDDVEARVLAEREAVHA
jgi:[acyl-carrier-protein] S-malonyltransferase